MDGKSKDVKALIKLRQSRPSFARMISWEFSKASDDGDTKRIKQRVKKQKIKVDGAGEEFDGTAVCAGTLEGMQDADGEDAESSDESEYDTAPEENGLIELCERLGDSVSTTDTFTSVLSRSTETHEEIGDELCDFSESDDDNDKDIEIVCGTNSSNIGERRRRRSKRQKRKRAKTTRLLFANEFLNFMNVFDAEDELESVFEETKENPGPIAVNRRVPSLVELCMKATRQKKRHSSRGSTSTVPQQLPYGIKRLLTVLRHDQRILAKQLSYLQNHILPRISSQSDIDTCINWTDYNKDPILEFPSRSIWTCLAYPVSQGDLDSCPESMIQTTKTPTFLYTPTMHRIAELVDNRYSNYYRDYIAKSPCALMALAVTIDLMLPGTMKEPPHISKGADEGALLFKSFQTMLIRVKIALRERYPLLVNGFFDLVIPYVMWARGNVSMATDMFHHLIKKEENSRTKAMYLSEIARMLQQFGDEEGACSFYKMAAEIVLTDSKVNDQGIDEVTGQTQVLLANVYDTGVLDERKCSVSVNHWTCASKMTQRKEATVIAGVESFLCYHAAHCEDWLTIAQSKINQYVEKCPPLLLHLSMIYALMGNENESRLKFREFRFREHDQTGDILLEYLGAREKNPWKPLLEIIITQKLSSVRPLEVVWRTQLLPPSLTNQRPMEAHFNSLDLNLRISETGHLTGDMQMFLPPQRDITLDPYTGSLVMNNCPSFIGEWQTAYLDPNYFYYESMLLPTPTLLATLDNGTTLHLLLCGHTALGQNYQAETRKCVTMQLYWTGPTGQVAKLNLVNELKDYVRKETENQIQQKIEVLKNHGMPGGGMCNIYDMVLKILQEAYNQNLRIDYNTILYTAEQRYRHELQNKKTDAQKKVKKTEKKKKPYMHQWGLNFTLEGPQVQFGQSVVLHIKVQNGGNQTLLLFIRLSCKAEFQSVKILGIPFNSTIMKQSFGKDEAFLCVYSPDSRFRFFNEFGTLVEQIDVNDWTTDQKRQDCDLHIVGPHAFGITGDRSSVWKHMIGMERGREDLEEAVTWSIVQYWSLLGKPEIKNEVLHLKTVGRAATGKLLLLHLSIGVGFMDPLSMEFVTIRVSESLTEENLTEDKKILIGQFSRVDILTENLFDRDGCKVCRITLAVRNTVFVLDLSREQTKEVTSVNLVFKVSLPGIPKEACLVSKEVGLLISLTMCSNEEQRNYHEHVFYFDSMGQLMGILPFLAKGPRSFHVAYLHDNSDLNIEQSSKAGLYVYMRDGKGGILGVRLSK